MRAEERAKEKLNPKVFIDRVAARQGGVPTRTLLRSIRIADPFSTLFFRSVTDSFVGLFARRQSSSAIRGAVYSATRVYSPCRFSAFYRRHTRQDEDIFGAAILILKSTPRSFERRSESQEFEFPTFPATEIARLLYRRTYYAPLRSFHLISFSFVSSLGNIKYFFFF